MPKKSLKSNLYYVVSFPKSGATWFRMLMYTLFHQKSNSSAEIQSFYPEVDNQEDLIENNIKSGKPFFVKSHYCYKKDLKYIDKARAIICIVRNPFNVMMSKLDHYIYEGVEWVRNEKGVDRFVDEFLNAAKLPPNMENDKIHGGWNYHLMSWNNAKLKIPIHFIRYEDLIDDAFNTLNQLCQRLEFDFSDEEIRNAIELSNFSNMKNIEKKELENETPGMFYSPLRRESYLEDNSHMFVNKGKERDAILDLKVEQILRGKMLFYDGMELMSYK